MIAIMTAILGVFFAVDKPTTRPADKLETVDWIWSTEQDRETCNELADAFENERAIRVEQISEQLRLLARSGIPVKVRAKRSTELRRLLEDVRSRTALCLPPVRPGRLGKWMLETTKVEVVQIVNDHAAIVQPVGYETMFWLEMPTADLHDEQLLDMDGPAYRGLPPQRYTTVSGTSRTIQAIERIDDEILRRASEIFRKQKRPAGPSADRAGHTADSAPH